jgi:hypothetical protein
MKKLLVLTILAPLLFLSCGGEKMLMGSFRTEGIIIGYKPASGKTLSYQNQSDEIGDVSVKGNTSSILSKSNSKIDITLGAVSDEDIPISYLFKAEDSGTFVNGEMQKNEESEMIGQTLTIHINPKDGKLLRWEGLDELTYNDAGMDAGQSTANSYASIIFDYFPDYPVKIGSKWEVVNDTKTDLKEGGYTKDTRTKSYELIDFVQKDGHKCAKCKVGIDIAVNTETTGESEDKVKYDVKATGTGSGDGFIYFDFENGYLVESSYNWSIQINQDATNVDTGELQNFTLFQESQEKFILLK